MLRQIDEVLRYDTKINTMVFGIEKKRVARYPDKRPESQYDADAETTMKDSINALRVLLDNRYAHVSSMQRPGISIISDQFSNAPKNGIPSRNGCAELQHSGCAVGVKPEHDVQTNDIEPHARATEYAGSTHKRTDIAGKSPGRKDRRRGYACAHILLCEVRRIASRFRPDRPLHQNEQVDTDPERGCRGARVGSDQQ